jgi:hypothetical protein
MDHGYNVDPNKRCRATTKKERPCALPALVGIDLCALHSGLAKAKGKPGYGDVSILEAYKRRLAQGRTAPTPLRAAARR